MRGYFNNFSKDGSSLLLEMWKILLLATIQLLTAVIDNTA